MLENQRDSRLAETFLLFLNGNLRASELVRLGKYDWSDEWVTDERFLILHHKPVVRAVEFVEFDHDPTFEEVLEELARYGLGQPTHEDALYFGATHPEEQRRRSLAFLHEPVLGPYGAGRGALVLSGDADRRLLDVYWPGPQWFRDYAYAGVVRKDLLPL